MLIRFVALAGAVAVVATSCGGSGSGGGPTGDVVVTMKDFSLSTTPATFSDGDVTFAIRNDGPSAHEFEADDIAPGTSTSLTVNLEPGSYVLVCNLPTHYEAGMRVAFTVA